MRIKKRKPYLGPLLLAWCVTCNVPLIRKGRCARCGEMGQPVPVTPPGDARPAFAADRETIIDTISSQFDRSVAQQLIPEDKVVLLNAIPDVDCAEEIIIDGQIIGLHRFRIENLSWEFIPKIEGARRLVQLTEAKQVVIEDSAVPFILKGASLLRPGIKAADDSIQPGEYVIGVTEQGSAILVGIAMMSGPEMKTKERGMAVKKQYKAAPIEPTVLLGGQTWETALAANKNFLHKLETEATSFITQTSRQFKLPVVVAYSGGKDSLAVLLLAQKALTTQTYNVMFINTGIEFPETVDNVYAVTAQLGLENQLLVKNVDKNQFFHVLDLYGFVARDYRVCCKSVKLGPTSQLIETHFPEGCLSLIGQRRYESHRRSASGRVWQNPWVPKQIGASPIHNWTQLMIWLYLFQEKAPYNPLYEKGFERIGCMFCPASNVSELEIIAKMCPSEWQRWSVAAEKLVQKHGLSDKWLKHGFWRWKNPPPKIRDLAQRMKIQLPIANQDQQKKGLTYDFSFVTEPTSEEPMVRGQFSQAPDIISAAAFLPALGDVVVDLERNILEVTFQLKGKSVNGTLYESGLFTLSGSVNEETVECFVKAVLRGLLCTACGTCQSLCENNAISLESGQARVDEKECVQCGKCLRGKCPTLYAL
ncbi:MAG: phosphoadenosine phosphosulfate reductase family protein [Promethearchaeota archaeon]